MGVRYGEGCPLSSRLGGLGSVVSSPSQGRINHGAKRAMAHAGPPAVRGPPRHQEKKLGYLIVIYIGNCLTSLFFELTTSYVELNLVGLLQESRG